jgi:hypothetical protein
MAFDGVVIAEAQEWMSADRKQTTSGLLAVLGVRRLMPRLPTSGSHMVYIRK